MQNTTTNIEKSAKSNSGVLQGHGAFKVRNSASFKVYLFCHIQWELANDDSELGDNVDCVKY